MTGLKVLLDQPRDSFSAGTFIETVVNPWFQLWGYKTVDIMQFNAV